MPNVVHPTHDDVPWTLVLVTIGMSSTREVYCTLLRVVANDRDTTIRHSHVLWKKDKNDLDHRQHPSVCFLHHDIPRVNIEWLFLPCCTDSRPTIAIASPLTPSDENLVLVQYSLLRHCALCHSSILFSILFRRWSIGGSQVRSTRWSSRWSTTQVEMTKVIRENEANVNCDTLPYSRRWIQSWIRSWSLRWTTTHILRWIWLYECER